MTRKTAHFFSSVYMLIGFICLFAAARIDVQSAAAQDSAESNQQEEAEPISNAYCLLCHEDTEKVWQLSSGETLSMQIDPDVLAGSVHGTSNPDGALMCADCHGDFRFPHPASTSRNLREFRLERYTSCRDCHEDQYTRSQDSVHGAALREGKLEAAVCVDCHGGHDIQSTDEPRERISLTCGRCHGVIFEEYRTSVHGAALLNEQNPDVPTCIDCHGVHNIQNPTTAIFRQRSPDLCAECHANDTLMTQYDISTDVFDSYLSDFHGTTVALFEQEAEDVVTNKAVCYDCHGVHNIQAIDDDGEGESAIRASLADTCRECHPDASEDFPSAWVGHYPATMDSNPGLFVANGLYDLLTPLLIVFLAAVVGSEVVRRVRQGPSNGVGGEGK